MSLGEKSAAKILTIQACLSSVVSLRHNDHYNQNSSDIFWLQKYGERVKLIETYLRLLDSSVSNIIPNLIPAET